MVAAKLSLKVLALQGFAAVGFATGVASFLAEVCLV